MKSIPGRDFKLGSLTSQLRGLGIALLLGVTIPAAAGAQGVLRPGDLVTISAVPSALKKVDPVSGAEMTLSDFVDSNQGPINQIPSPQGSLIDLRASVAIENATAVFVVHPYFGTDARSALFSVDPTSGVRTIISDFGNASQGPILGRPGEEGRLDIGGFAIESSGDFLVVALDADSAMLVRVDQSTGWRQILSDLRDPSQGPTVIPSFALAVEESGLIVVGGAQSNGQGGGLFRVDPVSGGRVLISDLGNPTPHSFRYVDDLTTDFAGNLIVKTATASDGFPFFNVVNNVIRIDPVTGAAESVSSCFSPGIDEHRQFPVNGVAVEDTGDIVAVLWAHRPRTGNNLVRLDPVSKVCTSIRGASADIWYFDVASVPTPLVNEMVSLSVTATTVDPPVADLPAPSGIFRIIATLTNETSVPVRRPFIRVHELSGGNLLLSGDRPPTVPALSGRGATQTPNVDTDDVLSPGESVTVEFGIGLQSR
jgi:hypothetical protein